MPPPKRYTTLTSREFNQDAGAPSAPPRKAPCTSLTGAVRRMSC
jgi:hypothetical protein